jgi:signal transduction histidine kinase
MLIVSLRCLFVRCALASLIALALVLFPSPATAQASHKEVLVLHSTRRDAEIANVAERELARALDAGLAGHLDYYSEFLDAARFPDHTYRSEFHEFLRVKYQNIRFDLVIALQDTAVKFVSEYEDGIIQGVPVVFLANEVPVRRIGNTAGVIHERNFAATAAFIRHVQPDLRTLFIITGAGPADKEFETLVSRQLRATASGPTYIYLSGLPTKALEQRLSQLPQYSAVYYLLVTQDGAGNRYHPLDYVQRVVGTANAPTYSWVDSTMDRGVVGGSLYSQRKAIASVARLALRVLGGEAADSIPLQTLDLNSNQADWRQLRRWHIDETQLPAGTVVLFRDPSAWERYRGYVVAGAAIVTTQALLITGLLIQRTRRQRAEERNRDLGARLLGAQEVERARVARDVHDHIGQSLTALKMDVHHVARRVRAGDNASAEERLREMSTLIDDAVEDVHRVAGALRPVIVDDDFGLVEVMRSFLRDVERRSGIRCVLATEVGELSIGDDRATALFRILQEATTNVVRHARATRVDVSLTADAAMVRLVVRDDGCGISTQQQRDPRALGLIGMQDRALLFGGRVEITGRPGEGTTVTLQLPARGTEP